MRYTRPELGPHKVAYKGRRYWVIEISETENFEYISRKDHQYAVWDGTFGAIVAVIDTTKEGKFLGKIIAHVDMASTEFTSLQDAAQILSDEADRYIDHIS